jgi:hypothetical protein
MQRRAFAVLFSIALFVLALPLAATAQAAPTTLTTDATDTATLPDGMISDTATLSGATNDATGTISFTLYGPFTGNDASTDVCDAAHQVTTLPASFSNIALGTVNAQGDYVVESPEFEPTEVGRYQWIASYSGDDKNEPSTTLCRDDDEASVVS